jgi:hypothetical protein
MILQAWRQRDGSPVTRLPLYDFRSVTREGYITRNSRDYRRPRFRFPVETFVYLISSSSCANILRSSADSKERILCSKLEFSAQGIS